MKHRDWLRLRDEGENLCAALRQRGYLCTKQTRRLSWKVTQEGSSYVLIWLPAPVGDWSILPNNNSPARQQLVLIVQTILKSKKGEAISQQIEYSADWTRPWTIIRLLPNCQRYVAARFFNRQDAEDHQRFLKRFIPNVSFEVVFDPPEIEDSDDFDEQQLES
ncbi:MAG TPA: hypothetical protein DCL61_13015 [Cyanobacteria bacterium UBA12227]|nr:hypothetical protein [Cyanobacteria bacterium UBA12227]HAX88328.1 hypothetical protein [Cyanobacteria bacterium UBA11370]HBY81137.1 hypothetical protein [Cyanobacteria bacterium UBA11148]